MYDPKELNMREQEVKNIWNKSGENDMINFDLGELIRDLKNNQKKFESKIRKRDRNETLGALGAIFFFAYIGYEFPFPSSKVAAIIGIIWGIYVIFRLRQARGKTSLDEFTEPMEQQLAGYKLKLEKQKKLLNTVWYWYVLPPFLSHVVLFLGMGNPIDYDWTPTLLSPPYPIGEKLLILGLLAAFYAYIVVLNLKAVRKKINPAILEVEQMQRQLDQTSE